MRKRKSPFSRCTVAGAVGAIDSTKIPVEKKRERAKSVTTNLSSQSHSDSEFVW